VSFANRKEAGALLGRRLKERGTPADIVLGLPRGGVVVAAEVARALARPLDALIVRKIGHPVQREFAVGAIAERGIQLFDPAAPTGSPALDQVIAEEKQRLARVERLLAINRRPPLAGLQVLLVDDGLATGATMEAAARSVRAQRARRVVVAVPVASPHAVNRLGRLADEILTLINDPALEAIGCYYDAFDQTSDEAVIRLLEAGRQTPLPAPAAAAAPG
jgi:putative phosphoribosyl transferase